MSLSEEQIKHLLVTAMAYDNRKPGESHVSAWGEAAWRERWDYHGALEAIHAHYATNTSFLMPAHITAHIKVHRQDEQMRKQLESEPVPDPIGQERLNRLIANCFQSIGKDYDPGEVAVRRAALLVRCPHCGAAPRSECTRAGRGGPVQTDVHPSRLELVEVP